MSEDRRSALIANISEVIPVNGYLVIRVEDPKSPGTIILDAETPKYLIGKVLRTSGPYVRLKDGDRWTREPIVPVGARVLFPSVYDDPVVQRRFYAWLFEHDPALEPFGRYILLPTSAVLLMEVNDGDEGGMTLDDVDLYT